MFTKTRKQRVHAFLLPIILASMLCGCDNTYKINPETKQVSVMLPKAPENSQTITALKTTLRAKYHNTPIGVIQLGDQLKLIYPSDILFGVGNTQLLDNSEMYLDILVSAVTALKTPSADTELIYTIEGLTDDSGSQAQNLKLSLKRAENVERYLQSQGFAQADFVAIKGYGGLYPVASNHSAEGRAKNRRVVITVSLETNKPEQNESAQA